MLLLVAVADLNIQAANYPVGILAGVSTATLLLRKGMHSMIGKLKAGKPDITDKELLDALKEDITSDEALRQSLNEKGYSSIDDVEFEMLDGSKKRFDDIAQEEIEHAKLPDAEQKKNEAEQETAHNNAVKPEKKDKPGQEEETAKPKENTLEPKPDIKQEKKIEYWSDDQLKHKPGNPEYLEIMLNGDPKQIITLKREEGGDWIVQRWTLEANNNNKLTNDEILERVPERFRGRDMSIEELKNYLWSIDESTTMSDVENKGVKALFRGTTRSNADNSIFPGNTNSINEPATSVSTDPVKATIFGIESQTNNPGSKGVLQIAIPQELTNVAFNPGNYRLEKELELILKIKPEEFSKLTQIEISIDEARIAIKDVFEIDLPTRINRDESTKLLETLPESSLQKSFDFYLYVLKLKGKSNDIK